MENDSNVTFAGMFEEKVRENLVGFLQRKGVLDKMIPQCPDVEEKWPLIAREYMPDGIREFQNYPTVSLGWMMFVGMALAVYWDKDWDKYASMDNIYGHIRALRGYDNLDEAVVEDILGYASKAATKTTDLVADCASRAYNLLMHEHIEPGTPMALSCYIAALHQLYVIGMAVQLNALGYHMTSLEEA